jgi:hypothetical protein
MLVTLRNWIKRLVDEPQYNRPWVRSRIEHRMLRDFVRLGIPESRAREAIESLRKAE